MSAARLVPVVRSRVATTAAPVSVTLRSITTTARLEKGPVDATKDTLKAADRVVSDAAVKGIDLGREASQKVKETVGTTSAEAESKAQSVKGEAEEYMGKGKGQAEELAGKAKGKMHEVEGKAKQAKREHLG
ncbi:uncharacterized protein N7473_008140 [Penicillium subrubescens]|uniref:LEA domain-containing protein n=1 Tax=Penicillium subrubescens TaxID=1316194 RepID=A0A1Q5TF48_9EURO|nr:uncharacterized protein N7473_008140 [Penicillium subrubescens]KAJ5891912.1 hypothetical protein N7473_008140 [Penicillium subrubescens]OKO98866.1 hypothetical protein PENSUB_8783 [Penicillium subrubescens]